MVKMAQLRKFNLPQELLIQFYSAIIESVLCTNPSGSAQLPNLTSGLLSESLVQPSSLSKNCTYPEWAKALTKSLWTPYIQHTPSLNCYHLVDATELWAPEWPDTETVSSLRQSISWTLDTKRGTHNTIIQRFIYQTLIFHLKFAHIRPVHK